MNRKLAILAAVAAASAASAQAIDIEPTATTVEVGAPVTLRVFADPGLADYAVAGWNASVHASGGKWANNMHHIPPSAAPPLFLDAGEIVGSSVIGISLGQHAILGFVAVPGRILMWSADFSSDIECEFDISTETDWFQIYIDPPTRRDVIPTEGSARITVIPTPGGLALLGVGGLAASRRRRRRPYHTHPALNAS